MGEPIPHCAGIRGRGQVCTLVPQFTVGGKSACGTHMAQLVRTALDNKPGPVEVCRLPQRRLTAGRYQHTVRNGA